MAAACCSVVLVLPSPGASSNMPNGSASKWYSVIEIVVTCRLIKIAILWMALTLQMFLWWSALRARTNAMYMYKVAVPAHCGLIQVHDDAGLRLWNVVHHAMPYHVAF